MKLLIICDPEEPKATEVTLYLKCEAERMNRRVVVWNANNLSRPSARFDAIVVVGELENNRFGQAIQAYVDENMALLNDTPWFLLPIISCEDENNLKVSDTQKAAMKSFIETNQWKPQQVLILPVGVRLQDHQFVTLTDWPELKISLQRFLIRNDVMMVS